MREIIEEARERKSPLAGFSRRAARRRARGSSTSEGERKMVDRLRHSLG